LNAKNANELFAACARKSDEQVEELLAARFPKPDVRDLIRRLPATTMGTPDIGTNRIETNPTEHFGTECVRSAAERTRKRARRVRFEGQRLDRPEPGQS